MHIMLERIFDGEQYLFHRLNSFRKKEPTFKKNTNIRGIRICILFILFFSLNVLHGQYTDIKFPLAAKGKVEIPFEYENNFIVLNIVFNRIFPLRFILDTGAEHTILTNREITDMLNVNYQKRFTILGADMKTELYAYLVRGINLKMDRLTLHNRSILVLEDDYFRFDQFSGINVHGIIGADLIRRFILEINYRKRTVTFYDPQLFERDLSLYQTLATEFHRGKPYLFTQTLLPNQQTIETKMLMDTGAGLSLLLYTNTDSLLRLPEKVIPSPLGFGLGGTLNGYLGRVQNFDLLPPTLILDEPITHFQALSDRADSVYLNNRNGIIGNKLLEHFSIILDYIDENIYVRPIQDLSKDYDFDRSGLVLSAFGANLNKFTVFYVIPDSPADKVGLQKGDRITSINGLPSNFFNMEGMMRKFSKKEGKKIKVKVRRGDEKLKLNFTLRNLL
ncbi:MAG: aspartyl protease family protein [Saprospiraceae bacterium]|nr:aspartyl protease family protein [Saprospiraceae bacterium]